jgi:hypothetical protein
MLWLFGRLKVDEGLGYPGLLTSYTGSVNESSRRGS